MKKFKITFYKEPYNADNAFGHDTKGFLTSADVTKSSSGGIDTFTVKLNDIGLNSLFGEFNIIRNNGSWSTSDKDSQELILLKQNIIYEIDILKE